MQTKIRMRKHTFREEINIKITKGIRILKKHYGKDVLSKIDTERLIMANAHRCIVGQLKGAYYTPLRNLYVKEMGIEEHICPLSDEVEEFGRSIGFSTNKISPTEPGNYEKWDILKEEWVKRIKRSRGEK